ncbi:hypothetical protein Ade02nite_60230 [Paractinoplanes deccanensis]|uniref:Uncharacterized protein n=1 Tax=Paractinoplanes deccanensis TaxID=113561 RepID=A0ABQ3YBN2_9ACTN|nr:hypothetical protein Ade02nite_60230 [Actinoplanes deccanensis]
MGRRGHSTTIGKFAKLHHDRRVSEIRRLGVMLRGEQRAADPPESRSVMTPPTAPHTR